MEKKARCFNWRTIFKQYLKWEYITAEILDTDLPWRSRKNVEGMTFRQLWNQDISSWL